MASRAVRERLSKDVSLWLADGLIPADTHALLRERYDAGSFGLGQAVKSIGVAGGLLAFFGLLGLVAATTQSLVFAGFMLMATGCGLTAVGIHLSADKLARHTGTSRSLLLLGVVSTGLGLGILLNGMHVDDRSLPVFAGALLLGPLAFLAYRFNNNFVLILALMVFFHWIGSWSGMLGRSTYALEIQDPRIMCLAALGVIVFGVYHERKLQTQTGRFFVAYETLGLIYLNLSLLILSIEADWRWSHSRADSQTFWVVLFFCAALAQIMAGARLHNSLFTSFGVTVFSINLFTRYFERYWHSLNAGTFLFLGGVGLVVVGFACELLLRQLQRQAAQPVQART